LSPIFLKLHQSEHQGQMPVCFYRFEPEELWVRRCLYEVTILQGHPGSLFAEWQPTGLGYYSTQCYTATVYMRVFKNKAFSRFADRNDISDEDLCDAVQQVLRGLIDADLGGGVIKQRIARKGEGKSGGFRSMVLFKEKDRAVFVHGFAKKDLGNVTPKELKALKKLAKIMLGYSDAQLTTVVASGALVEVQFNGNEVS
jgi:hypothetical protein